MRDECVVCLEPLSTSTPRTLACDHAFHEQCISRWLRSTEVCPVCRAPVADDPTTTTTDDAVDRPTCTKELVVRSLAAVLGVLCCIYFAWNLDYVSVLWVVSSAACMCYPLKAAVIASVLGTGAVIDAAILASIFRAVLPPIFSYRPLDALILTTYLLVLALMHTYCLLAHQT